jgi:hypothetical protein
MNDVNDGDISKSLSSLFTKIRKELVERRCVCVPIGPPHSFSREWAKERWTTKQRLPKEEKEKKKGPFDYR